MRQQHQHVAKLPGLLIVADVRLYREGIHASLSKLPQFSVIGAAGSADEARQLGTETAPDIVIVDMATRNSLEVVRTIRRDLPTAHIIGFGVDEVEGEVLACAEAGLAGYVPSDASLDQLVAGIESVCRGELLCTPKMAATLFRTLQQRRSDEASSAKSALLTTREREVLRLVEEGLSNKEISARLNIEVSTVKNHVHNLLDKLQVTSRLQAAARLGAHVTVRQRSLAANLNPV